jgi:hypothetical protein
MCSFGFQDYAALDVEGFSTFQKSLYLPSSGIISLGEIVAVLALGCVSELKPD